MKVMGQKSWRVGEALEPIELPEPQLRPREVRVAVAAIGVNPVDWKMRTSGPLRLAARVLGPPPPVVVGVDFAGEVEATGSRCSWAKPGDRVVGGTNFSRGQRGSYADTVIVREDQICRVPDDVELVVAGALPIAGVTAWRAVVEVGKIDRAQASERRVLVLGASGGVGQLAVQVAKLKDAFVVGVCSTRNIDLVRSLGADAVLDYTEADPLVQAREHAPYQVVVDCVGSYPAGRCRALLRRGGRHVMVAGDRMAAAVQVAVPPFSSKSILGKPTGALLRPLVEAVAEGRLRVNIARTMPLTEAEEAHRLSQSSRMTGKLVLVP